MWDGRYANVQCSKSRYKNTIWSKLESGVVKLMLPLSQRQTVIVCPVYNYLLHNACSIHSPVQCVCVGVNCVQSNHSWCLKK